MRALVCRELGPADKLAICDMEDPRPGPGEVVIDVKAAGLNFLDTLVIQGKYQVQPDLPFIPGGEAAGVIAEVGDGVSSPVVGDPVMAIGQIGAFAQRWSVPAAAVLPIPEGLEFQVAAGFGLTYGTSYYALKQRAGLQPGETVLVLGAAGGVGSAAVQIGKAMGARVIAGASTDEKLAFAAEMGADEGVNYVNENLRDRIKALTQGRGVDVVYDPVGGELTEQALRSTAWNGRLLVIGFASGAIPRLQLNLTLLKGVAVIGVFWGSWIARDPVSSAENFRELFAMLADGTLHPGVTDVYPFEEYGGAFGALSGRTAKGKVVLTL
ncbi:MAG: zinc-binding dehydrogenase [Gammaproteobacteria bacterium]|nr:zinc-binding dehydrogenase [Gammaproteobacteria bacterium]